MIFAVLIILVVGGIVWWSIHQKNLQKQALMRAWNAYQYALQNMHRDPALRAQVVNYGRAYYGMVRGGAVSIYDEMAISNDIKQAGG